MQKLLVFGLKGNIVFAGTWKEVQEENQRIIDSQKGFPLLTPMAEVSYGDILASQIFDGQDADYAQLKAWAKGVYQNHGRFGSFGDVMSVLEIGNQYILEYIAPKAFHKPGVATDLVPFFVDWKRNLYYVGIIRGQEPGKGKPGLIGGFNNIEGYHLNSSAVTVLGESREEAGMKMELYYPFGSKYEESPFPETFGVSVELLGTRKWETAYHLGTFYTSQEEENPSLGQKRVHITTGYVLPIRLEGVAYSKELLLHELVPEDLVENNQVVIYNEADIKKGIEFGIGHHEKIFFAAWTKLRNLLATRHLTVG